MQCSIHSLQFTSSNAPFYSICEMSPCVYEDAADASGINFNRRFKSPFKIHFCIRAINQIGNNWIGHFRICRTHGHTEGARNDKRQIVALAHVRSAFCKSTIHISCASVNHISTSIAARVRLTTAPPSKTNVSPVAVTTQIYNWDCAENRLLRKYIFNRYLCLQFCRFFSKQPKKRRRETNPHTPHMPVHTSSSSMLSCHSADADAGPRFNHIFSQQFEKSM